MTEVYSYSIPASLLRQYVFCPRIPYFILNRCLSPHTNLWVKQGINYHEKISMLARRRNFQNLGVLPPVSFTPNISLEGNSECPVHGICDGIIKDGSGQIFPLEFKTRQYTPNNFGSIIQLSAYSILLEIKCNVLIKTGFILFGSKGNFLKVNFTKELKEKVQRVIEIIHKDAECCLLPSSSASGGKCAQCEYLNFCSDRL